MTPEEQIQAETACQICGQINIGQTGEYPCPGCGLPRTWDDDCLASKVVGIANLLVHWELEGQPASLPKTSFEVLIFQLVSRAVKDADSRMREPMECGHERRYLIEYPDAEGKFEGTRRVECAICNIRKARRDALEEAEALTEHAGVGGIIRALKEKGNA